MGIESDAVVLFIGCIIIVLISELIIGTFLLNKKNKIKQYLYGHIGMTAIAYFFLFNCYFHTFDGISNMTFGIGLFIISWAISVVFLLKIIRLLSQG